MFCGSPVITCTSFCRAACPAEESVCGVNSHRYEIPSHSHLRDTPRVISGSGLERQTVQLFMTSVNASVFQGNFFDEFQLEGVSADANEIFLEVSPENLSRALKTAQNAKSVKIKLSKKSCPCLTLAAELVRRTPPITDKLTPLIILLCVCVFIILNSSLSCFILILMFLYSYSYQF